MTKTDSPPLLLDVDPPEPNATLAARYMRAHLDAELQKSDDLNFAGAPPDSIRRLLRLRYGLALADVDKKAGERWPIAVARASAARVRRARDDIDAYVVEWDAAAATAWFRAEVERRWPREKVGAPFLAADIVTLWTVCLALDLAPHRTTQFADDRFPAPPLLITGPTGIGKELLSKAIHERSGSNKPFGAINCGGLPTQLLESELFGHVKGAFTGATGNKKGLVEEYQHGTLFLDEVGDMPPEVQVRLLRFLNDGEARRLGANTSYHAFPRIIAATHVDLDAKAEKREFRRDLLHRLRGRQLHLHGLAERPPGTLAPVVGQFLDFAASAQNQARPKLTAEVRVALGTYAWPGNMRELKYVIERVLVRGSRRELVELDALPDEIVASYFARTPPPVVDVLSIAAARDRGGPAEHLQSLSKLLLGERLKQHEERTDTRAASLRRTAAVVERIGRALGLEKESTPHVEVLLMAAQEAVADEFQKETLGRLRAAAKDLDLDLEPAVGMYEAMAQKLREQARTKSARLARATKASEGRYAVTATLAAAVRVARESESKLVGSAMKFAETLLELAESAPFADAAKDLGESLRSLTLAEARAGFHEIVGRSGNEALGGLDWRAARNDLSALEHAVKESGSITAAAERFEKRPETLSRRLKELRASKKRQSRVRRRGKQLAHATEKPQRGERG